MTLSSPASECQGTYYNRPRQVSSTFQLSINLSWHFPFDVSECSCCYRVNEQRNHHPCFLLPFSS